MSLDSSGRDAILDTSAKLFSQQGYNDVSIRDIAQACGLTNAALYYHFKNKEDLFLAMLSRDHERSMVALHEAANSPGDLHEDLRQLVTRYAEIACTRRQSFQLLWRDMRQMEDVRARKLFGEMQHELLQPLVERLTAAQTAGEIKAGEVRLYTRLLYSMIMSLAHEGKPDKQHKLTAQEVELVVNVFLTGVKTSSR